MHIVLFSPSFIFSLDLTVEPTPKICNTTCRISCPFGYTLGEDNCPICECSIDPCLNMLCPAEYYCKRILPSSCSSKICMDPMIAVCSPLKQSNDYHQSYFHNISMNFFSNVASFFFIKEMGCLLKDCNKSCPYGYAKLSDGCNICECYNPCKVIRNIKLFCFCSKELRVF